MENEGGNDEQEHHHHHDPGVFPENIEHAQTLLCGNKKGEHGVRLCAGGG